MNFGLTMPNEKSYILGARKTNGYYSQPFVKRVSLDVIENFIVQNIKRQKKNGFKFASFNYINCIVGSGIIGIPFALKQSGFVMGLLLLSVVAFISDYSLILMIRSAHLCGSFTYQGLMEASYGLPGYILLSILQLIYPITAMISYNIIVADSFTKVLVRLFSLTANSVFVRRDVVVGIATLLVSVPLCLLKDLVAFARASLFSFVLVIFIIVSVFIRLVTLSDKVPQTEDAFQFMDWGIISSFGIMAFAFMCHHNVFLLYDSLENANQTKWDKITHWSVSMSLIILTLFGIAGYATFTGYTEGDLLENYCWNDDLINVTRFAFGFTVLLAFPIECMVARSVVRQITGVIDSTDSRVEHVVTTLSIIIITYLLSVTTNCLSFVLEMNGIFSAIPLAFVLPAVCYIKLEEGPLISKKKLPALGLAIFGICCALIGCSLIYLKWGQPDKCNEQPELDYCKI